MHVGSASDLARWAVEHAHDVPEETAEVASRLLAGGPDIDVETRVLAGWAAGLAGRELGHLDDARARLEEAARTAEAEGLDGLGAEIRSSLALILAYRGEVSAALRQADRAARRLHGAASARNEAQRALILQRLGRLDAALRAYDKALSGLREVDDRLGEARLLLNRGVLHGYRGSVAAGIADLESSRAMAAELGQTLLVAGASHNLGFLEGRRGDVPAALRRFDEASSAYEKAGNPRGHLTMLRVDEVDVLRAAGLTDRARQVAEVLVANLEENPNAFDAAEVYLVAARCALDAGDPAAAAGLGRRAEKGFVAARRAAWADLSRLVVLRAETALVSGSPAALSRRAARLGGRLSRAGLVVEAAEARLWAGRLAEDAEEPARARAAYRRVLPVGEGTALLAAFRTEAKAREALLAGDEVTAAQAVSGGIERIAAGLAALGGTELRARAAAQAEELVRLAVDLATRRGDPAGVLAAVESWRSLVARVPPALPPDDPDYEELLGELRRLAGQLEGVGEVGEDRMRLVERLGKVEADIVRLERRRRGSEPGVESAAWLSDLPRALGRRTLVAYYADGSSLRAVVVEGEEIRLVNAGDIDVVRREIRSLRFDLGRLAGHRGSGGSLAAARLSAEHAAGVIAATLLGEVASAGDLVIVPTGALHRLPWLSLPGLADRGVTVAPAITAWMRAEAARPELGASSRVVAVAGPDVPGAIDEARRVAGLYDDGVVLDGDRATSAAVRQALASADIAHIAAHGVFRTDNPLFSSLRMIDGPLTVYELELATRVPPLVVLSACDSAVNGVTQGDGLLGLSSALLGMGAAAVVGPLLPVPDTEAVDLMGSFHRELVGGRSPARALAASGDDDTPRSWATRRAFVAFGG